VSFDYTTVGHVTADVMADGSRRPGGSAFYAALQAARLGRRTLILTSGVREEIELLLAPFRAEFELQVLEAAQTTELRMSGSGAARSQSLLAWAGAIPASVAIDTALLHLAPVARETPSSWSGHAGFVGLTPQGLVRRWSEHDTRLAPSPLDLVLLPQHWDAIVISQTERDSCAALLTGAREAQPSEPPASEPPGHGIVAVTAGAAAVELSLPGGAREHIEVPLLADQRDDIGAGDVFAAAFFIALSEGRPPNAAVSFASAAASVRIAGTGAGAIGERSAIEARLREVSGRAPAQRRARS
jgi:1D-myo-inositol 3-kinase